jgi:hypothetical protein
MIVGTKDITRWHPTLSYTKVSEKTRLPLVRPLRGVGAAGDELLPNCCCHAPT